MMIVSNGTKKKRRVSKKSKLSWRKHVNIQDVDDFLEEQRFEERLGKPLDVLTNDELFQVDTKPATESDLTAKQKKRLRLLAPPKCFSALQPHTKVPDPIVRRNRVRTKEERMCPILKRKEKARRLNGVLKAKEKQQLKDRLLYKKKIINKPKIDDFNQDIWNANDSDDNFGMVQENWIEKETKRHTLRGLGKLKKIVPKPVNDKNPIIPSVEPPHPGTSYNPSYEDHQDLINNIAQNELKIIKEEEHLKRVTKDMFRKVTVGNKEASWLVEMSEGLPKPEDDSVSDTEYGTSYETAGAPVQNKKKTLKQRRKQKEQLQLLEMRRAAKLEKKKRADIHKLKVLNKDIEKQEAKAEKLKEKRVRIEKAKAKETKRLSKLKYVEPDLDFNFGKDIPGNLRNVKKEGSLLADRFKSLQKRNVLEVSQMQVHKKAKVKKYQRPGFKDDWKSTVARSSR